MDCYETWVNLAPGVKDLEFCEAINAYLDHLKAAKLLVSFRVRLRKFGFGPADLPQWNITMEFQNLTQMDECFNYVAAREGEVERLHGAVYAKVKDFKSALYRDFPDAVRLQ